MLEHDENQIPQDVLELKLIVRGVYQIQKLRVGIGLRIVSAFKTFLGQEPGMKEKELGAKELKLLEELRSDYKMITEGIVESVDADVDADTTGKLIYRKFQPYGKIQNYSQAVLIEQYIKLHEQEKKMFKQFEPILKKFPIYNEFLLGVGGVGPALSGILISEINIHKAEYPSSLWMYAGLDVASDGKGRSRRKEHLIDVEYIDSDGDLKTKKSITYNNRLKSKLMGVMASSFLRSGGDNSPYRHAYYEYKHRIENDVRHRSIFYAGLKPAVIKSLGKSLFDLSHKELADKDIHGPFYTEQEAKLYGQRNGIRFDKLEEEDVRQEKTEEELAAQEAAIKTKEKKKIYTLVNVNKTKAHRHQMALRYSVKRFLVDLYKHWRALEGLPVADEYSEAKLGMVHQVASEAKNKMSSGRKKAG